MSDRPYTPRAALLERSVPVTLEASWGGLANNTGLLRFEGDALVLEFETKDGVLEVFKSGVKSLRLPLAELEACRWQRGWLGGKIVLSVRSLAALAGVPAAPR